MRGVIVIIYIIILSPKFQYNQNSVGQLRMLRWRKLTRRAVEIACRPVAGKPDAREGQVLLWICRQPRFARFLYIKQRPASAATSPRMKLRRNISLGSTKWIFAGRSSSPSDFI
jgi:aromatic ring-cleaving dioxygenase